MTRFIDVHSLVRLVDETGVAEFLAALSDALRDDFLRWREFDKKARVASHSHLGVIELMPVADDGAYAFKYVNGHPHNTQVGLPTVMAFGVLAEVDTGYPVLLSELTLTTALRTAATSAMAAKALARPDSRSLALIGNGSQSEFQALAFHALLGIEEVRVFDTDPHATDKVHAPRYLQFLATAWDEWIALDPAQRGRATRCLRTGRSAASAPTCCRPAFRRAWGCSRSTPARRSRPAPGRRRGRARVRRGRRQRVCCGRTRAFVLTRPPGHHAGADFFGGYCFLNNAAIAAQALRDAGLAKVAVLDIDYHHGNGTQAIFYERADVFFASVHGDPHTEYPYYLGYADERGAGGPRRNLNLPLPRGTGFAPGARR
jgi:hypothetical protein